jgi:hypothetical protein
MRMIKKIARRLPS